MTQLLASSAITMEWIVAGIFIMIICFVMKLKRKTKLLMTVIVLIIAGAATNVLVKQKQNNPAVTNQECKVIDSGKVEKSGGTKEFVRMNCGGNIQNFEIQRLP